MDVRDIRNTPVEDTLREAASLEEEKRELQNRLQYIQEIDLRNAEAKQAMTGHIMTVINARFPRNAVGLSVVRRIEPVLIKKNPHCLTEVVMSAEESADSPTSTTITADECDRLFADRFQEAATACDYEYVDRRECLRKRPVWFTDSNDEDVLVDCSCDEHYPEGIYELTEPIVVHDVVGLATIDAWNRTAVFTAKPEESEQETGIRSKEWHTAHADEASTLFTFKFRETLESGSGEVYECRTLKIDLRPSL